MNEEISASNGGENLNEFLGVSQQSPWYQRPAFIGAAAVALILALLLFGGLGGSAKSSYATGPVQRQNIVVTVSATGNLEPTDEVEVGSEQSGLVDAVYVDNNSQVTKGQPLARLDPSRLRDTLVQSEAGLASAQAQVAQYQAALTKANSDLSRMNEVYRLSGGKVPAKTELDNARATQRQAAAQVRAGNAQVVQAGAQVSSARTNLSKATIYSPVAGVVLSRDIDPGQTVAASLQAPTLFTIAKDLSQMKLEVKVDEADVGQVKSGQRASFTVDAYPGRTFKAVINRVDLGANASSSTSGSSSNVVSYTAVLLVNNPDLALRPGMTATADIITAQKLNVLAVPNAALRFKPTGGAGSSRSGVAGMFGPPTRQSNGQEATITRGSRQTVYVLGDDGQPKAVTITVGDSNGTVTEVGSGKLAAGDKVITAQLASGSGSKAPSQNAYLAPLAFAILPRRLRRIEDRRRNG